MRRAKPTRSPAPTRVIAIACQPRSGSNLLATALNATGVAGTCDEMLHGHVLFPRTLQQGHVLAWLQMRLSNGVHRLRTRQFRGDHWVSRRLVVGHLARYSRRMMSADGVLAVKQFWGLYRMNMLDHGLDMHHWGVPVVWVRLIRNDRLAQAVSEARAQQSSQWRSIDRAVRPVQYDEAAVSRRLATIGECERSWDEYFMRTGESPLVITYEELDRDYEATMRRILDHVGLEGVPVPPPQLQRQRDALNDEWMSRYRAAHPDVD